VTSNEERATAEALKTTSAVWLRSRAQLLDLVKAKRFDEAKVLLYSDAVVPARMALEKAAQDAYDLQHLKMQQETVALSDSSNRARGLVLGLTGAAILLGFGLALQLVREITGGLGRVTAAARGLAKIGAVVETIDEIAEQTNLLALGRATTVRVSRLSPTKSENSPSAQVERPDKLPTSLLRSRAPPRKPSGLWTVAQPGSSWVLRRRPRPARRWWRSSPLYTTRYAR
jgi:hypothetical protein